MLRPTLLLGCLLALTACGANPADMIAPDEPITQRLPFPAEGHGTPDQDALDRLMAMERAQRALTAAKYTARVYARGSFGDAKPKEVPWAAGGEWEGRTTWEVEYARPEVYKLTATASTLKAQVGLRVLLEPKGASVRYPGLRGLVIAKRSHNHEDLSDFRGHALAQLTPAATVARLAGAATARLLGPTRLDGAELDLVEIPRTPAFDPEVAREVLGIERGTGALRLHAMYAADGAKVYEQQVLGFRPATGGAVVKLAL